MTDKFDLPEFTPTEIDILNEQLLEKDCIIDGYILKKESLKRVIKAKEEVIAEYIVLIQSNEDLIEELHSQLKRSSTLIENYEVQINKLMEELDD